MAVVSKLDLNGKDITKYNNATISNININGVDYHFAKSNEVDDGICEEAVNEPIIDMEISGNSEQKTYAGTNIVPVPETNTVINGLTVTTDNNRVKITGEISGATAAFGLFGIADFKSYLKSNTTYKISGGGDYIIWQIAYSTTGDTTRKYVNVTKTPATFEVGNLDDYTYLSMGLVVRGVAVTEGKYDPDLYLMFNEGTTSLDYEPYVGGTTSPNAEYPQEIESVGDKTKNLFNIKTITEGQMLVTSSGNLYANSSFNTSDFIKINENFTISWESDNSYFQTFVCYYDKDKNFISGLSANAYTYAKLYEVPENTEYVRFSYSVVVSGNPVSRNNIQLEQGNKTDYVPYGYEIKVLKKKSELPSEYQQVEYLQNNGTQYIDTGVLASKDNSFEVKAQLVNVDITSQTIWGGRNSATSGAIQGNQLSHVKSIGQYQFCCGNTSVNGKAFDTKLHTYYADKNKLYIDNTLIYTAASSTITAENSIYLFATNTAGTIGFAGGSLKMYYCKIWNNDVLVRNYIPCYRKSDNVAGLYDLVEGKFYTNAGTGEFAVGEPNDIGKTYIIHLNEPLRKIGDYADYIDYKNKKVVRNIYSEFMDTVGSVSGDPGTYKKFLTNIKHEPLLSGSGVLAVGYAMSNKFRQSKRTYDELAYAPNLIQTYITTGGAYRIAYTFSDTSITTVAQAQSAIGDGFEAYYVVAEPIEEAIDIPEISTLDGTTTFDIVTQLEPSEFLVNYWKQI